jgi:transketolase
LYVVEEHVQNGGYASQAALHLLARGVVLDRFQHFYARAHHFDRYGSQAFLRREAGIDVDSVMAALEKH